ncbi:MAG: endonuclease/exonuclease/phosphatase family protein [Planctomycetes bacterium]|nr:endonuclease/exonuclease/phosphatase family protein [Planctomycetota bacterium]
MTRARFLLFILLGLAGSPSLLPAQEAPTITKVDELSIGCWNLLNLFDNHDNPWRPDEGTPPKSQAELRRLARQIDRLGVDVLGVEEVENREVLETLNLYLERPFAFVELIEGNDFRGIDVGILSRLPIVSATSHRQLPLEGDQRFARDFPVFRLRLAPDRLLDVGVVHLKSKRGRGDESDSWRRAEALAIAGIVDRQQKLEPGVPMLVMGDFNDHRDAATLAPLFGRLHDLTEQVPENERYSFVFREKGEQIDFILATKGVVAGSVTIPHDTDEVSDHFPVVAKLPMDRSLARVVLPAGSAPNSSVLPVIDASDLEGAREHLLQEVVIRGKVVKVHRPESGANATLNLHEDYRRAVSIHVPAGALARLGDLDALVGKEIRVAGALHLYKGNPQILWTRPEQRVDQAVKPPRRKAGE